MKKSELRKIIREEIKVALEENQPAPKPSPSTKPGTSPSTKPGPAPAPKPRHPFQPRPGVRPKPKAKAMYENEQDLLNKIVKRYKSKK